MILLEYKLWSHALAYIATENDLNLLDLVLDNTIRKHHIESWSDVDQILTPDIFGSGDSDELNVIDYGELRLNKFFEDVATKESEDTVYLVSSTRDKLLLDETKLVKKLKLAKVKIPNPKDPAKMNFIKAYCAKIGAKLSPAAMTNLAKQTNDYYEIIDVIDTGILADDLEGMAKDYTTQEPQLFMLGFHIDRLTDQVKKWHSYTKPGEEQMAMSLVFGKLLKLPKSSRRDELLRELILSDYNIKTGKIEMATAWKLFLWKSMQS